LSNKVFCWDCGCRYEVWNQCEWFFFFFCFYCGRVST